MTSVSPAVDLSVTVGALALRNPVMTASGTSGCGEELSAFIDLGALGAFVTKGVTLEPRVGNAPPRIVETCGGMLNAIGLQNAGLQRFLKEQLPPLKDCGTPVVVNVAGNTIEEYVKVTQAVCSSGIPSAIELNVSCPNVKQGGLAFGKDCVTLQSVVSAVRESCCLPLWVKLTPNVTDIGSLARAAEQAGADALVAVNTFVGMALDIDRGVPALANRIGGLSGPAIKPLALYAVDQVIRATSIPVIAVGGIMTGRDALEFMALGAVAFQLGTGLMIDPTSPLRILSEMREILAQKGLARVQDWIGVAKAW